MQVVIKIPENEIPAKQDIISIDIHFMDGKIVECDYPFIELPPRHEYEELLEAAQKFYAIHKDCVINDVPVKEYLEIGLKALEQEPVIDKIRSEIENHCGLIKDNHCKYCSYCNNLMGVGEILKIIDKYKTERE